ncbi:MAG TPA: hypothetical protein VGO37_18840 [Steroidobacteraceae bacterium]|jgi:hypothetical protein|nr:hypothetical protein [Steroidobacteraceae bacterium]
MNRTLEPTVLALAALISGGRVLADVTIQQQTTIHAFIVKAHGMSTDRIAGDKQRNETQFSCDGIMSMFCGHNKAVDIVRVDRGVTWKIEPKQKRYTEIPFPTPEARRAALEHEQAVLEKLKSCPQPKQPAAANVDTSQCEMTPAVFAVNKTQDVSTIIGHSAQRTNVSMTQSCKVKDSGDICSMSYSFDVWLTQDDLPGLADRMTFEKAYQRKLGGTDASPFNTEQMSSVLAPYADSLKQLKAKAADFKGYPLRTTFRFAVGGEHCRLVPSAGAPAGGAPQSATDGTLTTASAAAGEAGANSAQHAAGWGASDAVQRSTGSSIGGYVAGSAAGAFTQNLVSGLFGKKKKPDPAPSGATSSAGSQPASREMAGTTVAEINVETTAIDPAPVAADQFEVPDGWKKLDPKPAAADGMPSCPGT